MPQGFSSAARNLFLLGASGQSLVSNFFRSLDQSSVPNTSSWKPRDIIHSKANEKYYIGGQAFNTAVSGSIGFIESRDWDAELETTTQEWSTFQQNGIHDRDLDINYMGQDAAGNLIVVGGSDRIGECGNTLGKVPYIAKYSTAGVLDWQSTTNSGGVSYRSVCSDSNNTYYACGHQDTNAAGQAEAFVEKFDADGNPSWGKSCVLLGREIELLGIAANDRGEVVAVGSIEDDSVTKGFIIKIDTSTGEVLWDRTIRSHDTVPLSTSFKPVTCEDIYIDDNDQIYVVGGIGSGINNVSGFIIKYTAEGNVIWQKETVTTNTTAARYYKVKADTETEQVIVYGSYFENGSNDLMGILTKYNKAGNIVWRRTLNPDTSSVFGGGFSAGNTLGMDADPSDIYLLYTDGTIPNNFYSFGRVSSAGNGLGNFQYDDGQSNTIDYNTLTMEDKIGTLYDGSVSQNNSDLVTYPFSANKLLFDDLATHVSNKKRQMDSGEGFDYSGSPAIRVKDFPLTNLGSGEGTNDATADFYVYPTLLTTKEDVISTGIKVSSGFNMSNSYFYIVPNGNEPLGGQIFSDNPSFSNNDSLNRTEWFWYNGSGWTKTSGGYSNGDYTSFYWGNDTVSYRLSQDRDFYAVGDLNATTPTKQGGQAPDIQEHNDGLWVDQSSNGNNTFTYTRVGDKEPGRNAGSVTFDGTNDFIDVGTTSDFKFLHDDKNSWTAEYFVYPELANSRQCIFSTGGNSSATGFTNRIMESGSTGGSNGYYVSAQTSKSSSGNYLYWDSNPTTLEANRWYHIALVYDAPSSSLKIYVDGQLTNGNGTPTESGSFGLHNTNNSSYSLNIGQEPWGSVMDFDGFISNLHIVKDVQLYTSNFTPPTAPLDAVKNSVLLTCRGETIVDESPVGHAVSNSGAVPAVITATGPVLKEPWIFGSNGYWLFDGNTSMTSDVTAAELLGVDFTVEAWIRRDGYTNTQGKIFTVYKNETDINWALYLNGGSIYKLGTGGDQIGSLSNLGFDGSASWYHVVMTHTVSMSAGVNSLSRINLYVNGQLRAEAEDDDYDASNAYGNLIIGKDFEGEIAEVRVYPKILSGAEAFQNYNAGVSKYYISSNVENFEAPSTSPQVVPGIVSDDKLKLNYDFGNRACYEPAHNLSEFSQNFTFNNTSTGWRIGNSYSRATLIANKGIDSPIGTMDASRWQSGDQTNQELIYHILPTALTIGETYTASCWIRRVESFGNVQFYLGDNITLDVTSQVDAVPFGEWVRVSATRTITGENGSPVRNYIAVRPNGNVNGGDKTTIDVWGMNVNQGTTPNRYIHTVFDPVVRPSEINNLRGQYSSTANVYGTLDNGEITGAEFNSDGYFDFGTTSDQHLITSGNNNCSVLLDIIDSGGSSTIECWALLDDTFTRQTILSGYTSGDSKRWDLEVQNGNLQFHRHANGTTSGTGGVSAFDWSHIVVTRGDGSDARMRIYLNGSEVGTSLLGGPLGSNVPLGLGMRADGSTDFPLDGKIGEVRTYKRFLSATEVSQNYNATRGKYGV